MKMHWTIFEGRPHGYRAAADEVRITLGHKGAFYLNGKAFAAMGEPAAVELMYDDHNRIIGLRPTAITRRNAFRVRRHGGHGSYKRISAAAFCRHFGFDTSRTLLFDTPELDDDGVMRLDLKRTTIVTLGAR